MATTIAEPVYWSASKKVLFRFAFIFFPAYLINPFSLFTNFVNWFAQQTFNVVIPTHPYGTGSGDTMYNYIVLLLVFALSLIGTLVWSLFDTKTRNYNKMYYWLTVIVRFYLGTTMLSYGFIKVIKLQFPLPGLEVLLENYGNSSPMRLAWTYLGYSTGFNYFMGLSEVCCGLLLLFRRTTTIGALLGIIIAGNIMAVNYCFDVPVKLMSTMLVIMCVFLLLRDAERLVNVFFLNKTALPANLSPHRFKKRWVNITLLVIKYLLITYALADGIVNNIQEDALRGDNAKKPPLYGIYKVDSFVRNNDTVPPLTSDDSRWNQLIISNANTAHIKLMNDSSKYFVFKADTQIHQINMNNRLHTLNFVYNNPQPNILFLDGKDEQGSLKIKLIRLDEKQFLLLRRGFHWINEYPLNR